MQTKKQTDDYEILKRPSIEKVKQNVEKHNNFEKNIRLRNVKS